MRTAYTEFAFEREIIQDGDLVDIQAIVVPVVIQIYGGDDGYDWDLDGTSEDIRLLNLTDEEKKWLEERVHEYVAFN